jgi:GrpB-like predicted nucleotidyltransferase (UPF0157 family)
MADPNPSDAVLIVAPNPAWSGTYRLEAAQISQALDVDFMDIQHIGSTAVPDLAAKPTIDILVAVRKLDSPEVYSCQLEVLGYRFESQVDDAIRLFFRKGTPRTHHLHIVEFGTWEYRRHLLFRDYLRAHPDTAQAYERLKRELAAAYAHDRASYTASKTDFIVSVMDLAAGERAQQDKG